MPRRLATMLTPLACLLALAGCGDSEMSRGTSGAAIGAGTGAAVCAVTVIGVLPCAIVGAALGTAGGVATAGPDSVGPLPDSPPATPTVAAGSANASLPASVDSAGPGPGGQITSPQPRAPVTSEPLQ